MKKGAYLNRDGAGARRSWPGTIDGQSVTLHCQKCGHPLNLQVGQLENSPDIDCSGCGEMIRIDAKHLGDTLRKADQMVDDIRDIVRTVGGDVH